MSYKDIPARPTLYKGIRMRSRLEANFAAYLDGRGDEWKYEPQCFASADGQWLPDFSMPAGDEQLYIELKPYGFISEWRNSGEQYDRVNSLLKKMMIARESEPKCHLWLVFWEYGDDEMELLISHPALPEWLVSGPFMTVWPSVETQAIIKRNGR